MEVEAILSTSQNRFQSVRFRLSFEDPGCRIKSGMTNENKRLKAVFDFISISKQGEKHV